MDSGVPELRLFSQQPTNKHSHSVAKAKAHTQNTFYEQSLRHTNEMFKNSNGVASMKSFYSTKQTLPTENLLTRTGSARVLQPRHPQPYYRHCSCKYLCQCEVPTPHYFSAGVKYLNGGYYEKVLQKLNDQGRKRLELERCKNGHDMEMKYKIYVPSADEVGYPRVKPTEKNENRLYSRIDQIKRQLDILKQNREYSRQQKHKHKNTSMEKHTEHREQIIRREELPQRTMVITQSTSKVNHHSSNGLPAPPTYQISQNLSRFAKQTFVQASPPQHNKLLQTLSSNSQVSEVRFSTLPNSAPKYEQTAIYEENREISYEVIDRFHDREIADAARNILRLYNIRINDHSDAQRMLEILREVSLNCKKKADKEQMITTKIEQWIQTKGSPQLEDNSSIVSIEKFNNKLSKVYSDIGNLDKKLEQKTDVPKDIRLGSLVRISNENSEISHKMINDIDQLIHKTERLNQSSSTAPLKYFA